MGATEFGQQTERRRKRIARFVAAGLVAALLVIAAYRWKGSPAEKQPAAPQSLPSNANQQLSGYSFTRSEDGRQIFTVHAARTVAFNQGGETVLNDVGVEVFGRSGNRHDLIRTRSCNYNRATGELHAEGKVEIELNAPPNARPEQGLGPAVGSPLANPNMALGTNGEKPPILLETSRLSFIQQGALVVSDASVSFRVGLTTGTAQGLAYATRDDWLELKRNVVIETQTTSRGQSSAPLRLEASRLRYEKASGIATLWGPVEITQQGSRVSAASGKVYLDAQNRVTAAELEGDVSARMPSGGSVLQGSAQLVHAGFDPESAQLRFIRAEGGVQAESKNREKILRLLAQRFQMIFSGKPARPENGNAEGDVRITSEAIPGRVASTGPQPHSAPTLSAAKQDLAASAVNFTFSLGGKTLQAASTVGPGKIVLIPNDPKVGQRVITADPFVMEFDANGRPAALRGLAQAHIVFMPPPSAAAGTPDAATSSDRLLAAFDPRNHTLSTVDQTGDFRFEQGNQQAFAEHARYEARTEVVELTGHPQVQDEETHARADRILIDTGADTAEGLGHVQATHMEKTAKISPGQPGDPTHIVADRMLAKRQSQFIHYEGHVRAWHGQDVVESAALDVFKAERRVRSNSRVLTSFLQSAAETPGAGGKSRSGQNRNLPVTIRADGLEYFEDGRKAIYRGNVQLDSQDTTLRSDRLDIFFSPASQPETSEVERAVAEGHVTVVQPARRATGNRAEYFAGPGKILVTGGPPTLYDAEKGFTTGRQLTFFLRDDRIFLDGGEESPTLSKHRIPQ